MNYISTFPSMEIAFITGICIISSYFSLKLMELPVLSSCISINPLAEIAFILVSSVICMTSSYTVVNLLGYIFFIIGMGYTILAVICFVYLMVVVSSPNFHNNPM